MWHKPCQRCKYITTVDIEKRAIKNLFTHVESRASAVSLLESGEQRCIKAIIIIIITRLKTMCEKIITIMSAFDDTRQT